MKLYKKILITSALLSLSFLVFSAKAYAANRYWVGESSSNTNDPENWSGSSGGYGGYSVPGSSDTAIFDGVNDGSTHNDTGLRGYWKLDEAASPSVDLVYGNNGTWSGSPVSTVTVPVPPIQFSDAKAMSFNGGSQYVQVGDMYDFVGNAPFTLSVWIKRTSAPANVWPRIMSKEVSSGTRQGWLLFSAPSGVIGFGRYYNNSGDEISVAVNNGEWTYITAVYDGSTMYLYKNGELASSRASGRSMIDIPQSFRIGRDSQDTSPSFNGLIDDTRIYNRALTQEEITTLASGVEYLSPVSTVTTHSNSNVTINSAWSVGTTTITSGYSGTITQGAGVTYTVGAGGYSQAGGNFGGGNSAITVNGPLNLTGGIFNSTTNTLSVAGAFTNSSTFNGGSGPLTIGGAFTNNASGVFNASSATTSIGMNQNFTINASSTSFNAGTGTVMIQSGGWFGTNNFVKTNGNTFYNFVFYGYHDGNGNDNANTITYLTDNITVTNNLSVLTGGCCNTAFQRTYSVLATSTVNINVGGNFYMSHSNYSSGQMSTFGNSNINLNMTGAGKSFYAENFGLFSIGANVNFNGSGQTLLNAVISPATTTIAQASGSVALSGNSFFYNLVINSGSVLDSSRDGGNTSYNLTVYNNLVNNAGATGFVAASGTVTFSNSDRGPAITTGGIIFNNLTLYAGAGTCSYPSSIFNDSFSVSGILNINSPSDSGCGRGHAWSASVPIAISLSGSLTMTTTGMSLSFGSNITVNMTGNSKSFLRTGGTFSANLNFNGTGITLVSGGTVGGGTTTINQASDSVVLNGNASFYNLVINSGKVLSATNGDTSYNLTIYKDFTNKAAETGFVAGSGTVTYNYSYGSNGTSVIYNATSTVFNNLTLVYGNYYGGTGCIATGYLNGSFTVLGNLNVQNSQYGYCLYTQSPSMTMEVRGNFTQNLSGYNNSLTFGNANMILNMTGSGKSFLVTNGTFAAALNFNGTGITLVTGGTSGLTTVNQSSGFVALNSNTSFYSLVINSGASLDVSPDGGTTSYNLTINGNFTNFASSTGLLTRSAIFYMQSPNTGGAVYSFNDTTVGKITFLGSCGTWSNNTWTNYINGALNVSDQLVVTRTCSYPDWYAWTSTTTATINVSGSFNMTESISYAGRLTFGNANFLFNMTGSSFVALNGTIGIPILNFIGTGTTTIRNTIGGISTTTLNKTSGYTVLASDSTFCNLVISAGNIFDTSPDGGTTVYTVTILGTFVNNAGSTGFIARTGTFKFYINGYVGRAITVGLTTNGTIFYNLTFYFDQNGDYGNNTSYDMTINDDITISNNLSFTSTRGYCYNYFARNIIANIPITLTVGGSFVFDNCVNDGIAATIGNSNMTVKMIGQNQSALIRSGSSWTIPFQMNLDLSGTGITYLSSPTGGKAGSTTINQTSGVVYLNGNSTFYNLVISPGAVLDSSPDNGSTSYNINVMRDFINNAGATGLISRAGTVTFTIDPRTVSSLITTTNNTVFNNVTFYYYADGGYGGGYTTVTRTLNDNLNILGNLLITQVYCYNYQYKYLSANVPVTLTVGGNVTVNNCNGGGNSAQIGGTNMTINMNGVDKNLTINSGYSFYPSITLNGSGVTRVSTVSGYGSKGTFTVNQSVGSVYLVSNSTFNNLVINSGSVFNVGMRPFSVSTGGNVEVFAWGAGGAGGTVGGWSYGAPGGAGGAAYGIMNASSSTQYPIIVGGGGVVNSSAGAAGGGGAASCNNSDNRYSGGGGGYSGVFSSSTINQANALIVAGGGGGGGSSRAGTGNSGGGGGGSSGQVGYSPYDSKSTYGGNPGTASAAGADTPTGCSTIAVGGQGALQGGMPRCNSYGGGGGGGYWGGSAGGYSESNTMGGGGGGSGYFNPTYISSGILYAATGITPGNSSSQYIGTSGTAGTIAGNGSYGSVVIRYPTSSGIVALGGSISDGGGYRYHTYSLSSGAYNLTVNGYLTNNGTFNGNASSTNTITITGNLTNSGIFNASSATTSVAGNFTMNPGAVFNHSNGIFNLNGGSQSIVTSGDLTFYSLTKYRSGGTLTFNSGYTYTILASTTFSGSAYNSKLYLSPSLNGTPWNFDPRGTRDFSYLAPWYSNNINSVAISALNSSASCGDNVQYCDRGYNVNWNFGSGPRAYWKGPTGANVSGNYWASTSGGAAGSATIGPTYLLFFDGTATSSNAVFDAGAGGTYAGIYIDPVYSGTITQARSLTLTSQGFVQNAGTFNGSASAFTTNTFTQSGGVFNSPSAMLDTGTFAISGGIFNASSTLEIRGSLVDNTTSGSTDLSSGMVGYWKLDEGVAGQPVIDYSGNNATGTAAGSPLPSYTSSVPVPPIKFSDSNAIILNGTSQYVSVTDASSLKPTTGIYISAWIYMTSYPTAAATIFDHESATPYYGYYLMVLKNGSNYNLAYEQYSNSSNTGVIGSTNLQLNTWYHVSGGWDGSNMKVYVNGVSDATPVAKIGSLTYTVTVNPTIGIRSITLNTNSFNGSIDDVRIYNRALSATEVLALYNGNNSGMYSGGAFVTASSTVNLTGGSQSLTSQGTTTFWNLAKSVSSNSTLSFSAGKVFQILNNMTFSGGNNQYLNLRSSQSGTQWKILPNVVNPSPTNSFNLLNIQDSFNIATGTNSQLVAGGSIDNGNNTNWLFSIPGTTMGWSGTQVATTTISVDGVTTMLGGAFTATRTNSGPDLHITGIKFTQNGSLSNDYISNVRLYYSQTSGSCDAGLVYNGSTMTAVDSAATYSGGTYLFATSTGQLGASTLPVSYGQTTCLYLRYSTVGSPSINLVGRSIDLSINNPLTDVFIDSGNANSSSIVDIQGANRATVIDGNSLGLGNVLSIATADPATNPTIFYVQSGSLWMKQGSVTSAVKLTPTNITATGFSFVKSAPSANTQVVKITLNINEIDPINPQRPSYSKSMNFTATVRVSR